MASDREYVVDRAAGAGQGEQRQHQIGRLARLPDAAVGDHQRELDLPLCARSVAATDGALKHRLQMGSRLLNAGAHDRHLMRLEPLDLLEGLQERLVEHLRLPGGTVAAMDQYGAIGLGVVAHRLGLAPRRDRLLHAAEQGFRLALRSLRFDGGDCRAAGGQQILKLASSGEPHRQQWIDSSGKLWLTTLLQRSVTQLFRQRLLAIFVPDRSEPRRWMDDKRLHVASLGELFKAHELREGKRFEARDEQRLVVGLVAHALAKRRG
jgi:hypothetical protein